MRVRGIVAATLAAFTAVTGQAPADVAVVPFSVPVVNRSGLPVACPTDGRTYRVRGQFVGPSEVLRRDVVPGAALYLHGAGSGLRFGFRFDAVPGYDVAAELARRGRVSVLFDRLGYDSSGIPHGFFTCHGAHADIATQLARALRAGTYDTAAGSRPRFSRLALVGQSAGAISAQLAAYSSPSSFDGLVVMSWADDLAPGLLQSSLVHGLGCLPFGEPKRPGAPRGYKLAFADTPPEFVFDAEPQVRAAINGYAEADPCGDAASVPAALVTNRLLLGSIRDPVLLLEGAHDPNFPAGAFEAHRKRFTGSRDVTLAVLPRASHIIQLERTAPALHDMLAGWLGARGF